MRAGRQVRVSLLLRAMGYAYGQSLSFARLARPVAEEAHLRLAGRPWVPRALPQRPAAAAAAPLAVGGT